MDENEKFKKIVKLYYIFFIIFQQIIDINCLRCYNDDIRRF